MRSTAGSNHEQSTPHQIVTVACELIAERGASDTSVREVARVAGVSAPLVIHHFGSKAGLIEACDRRVTDALEEVFAPMRSGEPLGSIEGGWLELLSSTPYLGYVTRSIRDGGQLGENLFDELFQMSLGTDQLMRESGVARPTDDPEMRALLLMALDMGMLLLSGHAERVLGAPLDSPKIGGRWVRSVVDLMSNGWLIQPDQPSPSPEIEGDSS